MVNIDDESGEEIQYTTAVEVDGTGRTLDSFMKQQDEKNDQLATSLDQIMTYMTKVGSRVGVAPIEDQGSNVKGKNIPIETPPLHKHDIPGRIYKLVHGGPSSYMANNQFYTPPPVGRVYHNHQNPMNWSREAHFSHSHMPKYYFNKDDWAGCPWDFNAHDYYVEPPQLEQREDKKFRRHDTSTEQSKQWQ
jgi:hypothetical protein